MTKPTDETRLFDPFGILPLLTSWGPVRGAAQELRDIDSDCIQTMLEGDSSGAQERYRKLTRLMRILHVDPEAIRLNEAALMRELEANCSRCPHRDRCLRELAAGTIAETYPDFCLNAGCLDRLKPD